MKAWKNPSIEELSVSQTAHNFSGNTADDGFFNGITQEMGYWTDLGKNDSDSDNIVDELS